MTNAELISQLKMLPQNAVAMIESGRVSSGEFEYDYVHMKPQHVGYSSDTHTVYIGSAE